MENKDLKKEVLELLNEAFIKLKDVSDPKEYYGKIVTSFENDDEELEQYLACLKSHLLNIINSDIYGLADGLVNEDDYYNSGN